MYHAELVVLLLVLVAGLVIIANRWAIPYPVLLVLGGLTLSFLPWRPVVRLDPNLVLFFFLPPLLYPAAIFTSWRDFRRNLGGILFLAIGLVLVTTTMVAWVAHSFVVGLPWAAAFALGAIVSPPDAVAVEAILKRLRVPVRIQAVLSGESLVNDATALVAYQFAIAAMVTGEFSLGVASLRFIFVGVGGVAVGLAVGIIIRQIQRRLDDPPVQITISLLTPFAAYVLAERLGVSGVLSVVASGVYIGWHAPSFTARYRLQALSFWEMVAFLLNGFIFIMIGLQLPGIMRNLSEEPLSRLTTDALGYLRNRRASANCLGLSRNLFAALAQSEFSPPHPAPPWRQSVIVAWAGNARCRFARGGVSRFRSCSQIGNLFPVAATFCFSPFASS
jgi:CPA1 family monovalent cation:H+ antiporter